MPVDVFYHATLRNYQVDIFKYPLCDIGQKETNHALHVHVRENKKWINMIQRVSLLENDD